VGGDILNLMKEREAEKKRGGASRIQRGSQKVGQGVRDGATLGQAGPKVAEIAAMLAQHLKAQDEEPPSKKRHREEMSGELERAKVNNNAVIPSLENKNKDEDTLLNLETSNNALAVAGDQPRYPL
jgi:hypothetical protein